MRGRDNSISLGTSGKVSGYSDSPCLGFGKHKGRRLDQVPRGYLKWIINADDMPFSLRQAARNELQRRGERCLPAATVIADIEDELAKLLCEDEALDDGTCASVSDHVLEAFEAVRRRHGIGAETELFVPPRPEATRQ